jgi:hypothetical protein
VAVRAPPLMITDFGSALIGIACVILATGGAASMLIAALRKDERGDK